jgi:MFS family permease
LEYYIPIYYQVVHQFSPEKAGYMMLPITIGFTTALVFQGFVTSAVGYYTPFMILSSIIMPIGAGLVSTWTRDSGYPLLIISSALVGVGTGIAFEVPQICVQTVLSDDDGPLGLSVTLFAQNFGGALFISIAQQVFTSQLLKNLQGKIPNLTPTSIQSLGLLDLYPSASDAQAQAIVDGLEQSFKQIWYFAIALSCASLIGSLFMEWRSVKVHTE